MGPQEGTDEEVDRYLIAEEIRLPFDDDDVFELLGARCDLVAVRIDIDGADPPGALQVLDDDMKQWPPVEITEVLAGDAGRGEGPCDAPRMYCPCCSRFP